MSRTAIFSAKANGWSRRSGAGSGKWLGALELLSSSAVERWSGVLHAVVWKSQSAHWAGLDPQWAEDEYKELQQRAIQTPLELGEVPSPERLHDRDLLQTKTRATAHRSAKSEATAGT